ncbi:ExbD/TolR family protein [Terriglobus saanensis]|uniref:Biopolymer transport protein ExbD/TolR n=1 Tax=Terriglobus saanensis (strain ATCC BAA-1853 / DSM 23119 / SP1PR4) TaxID=401053 RepID=E8V3R0_TERSS|nr:biopolymer transporter ExbD [Terriglobus saanensis]ADV84747.1 Biopolymer transport protein ExbD/TolR [Terriglobus saanensis SP1PR4]
MGMAAGGGGGARSDINVTPLIDVLLVLLIIFMVIQPNVVRGMDALVPQPPKNPQNQDVDPRTIVVSVQPGGGKGEPVYMINEQPFPRQDMTAKLRDIFATRNDKVMFVKGDKDLDFGRVAEVIDFGHQAGVDNIGIITPRVLSGQ